MVQTIPELIASQACFMMILITGFVKHWKLFSTFELLNWLSIQNSNSQLSKPRNQLVVTSGHATKQNVLLPQPRLIELNNSRLIDFFSSKLDLFFCSSYHPFPKYHPPSQEFSLDWKIPKGLVASYRGASADVDDRCSDRLHLDEWEHAPFTDTFESTHIEPDQDLLLLGI